MTAHRGLKANLLRERANMAERRTESWRPQSHALNESWPSFLIGRLRRFLDLQIASIWRDISAELPGIRGTALDVGCGAQPFRRMFHSSVKYIGIDSSDAKAHFDYDVPDTLYYEGPDWPVANGSVDFILCTEALEHVYDTRYFLAESRRCLVNGGRVLFTVPFAARWHYIPHDYWRFTPSSLKMLMAEAGFTGIEVYARGNEITVASYKAMALILPLVLPQGRSRVAGLMLQLIGIFFMPLFLIFAVCGNLSLLGRGGDDCLGYTVVASVNAR
jgi:SAM-dependent methyltransferase